MATRAKGIVCRPLTPERWADLERLFGPRGACAGCWCMWFRRTRAEFKKGKGAANRRALKRLVDAGAPTGLLAYVGGEPAGWCAVAPREDFTRLERSRVLKPVDERPAWAVPCFFVAARFRRLGVSAALLEAAAKHAARSGATLLEGYPVEPRQRRMPDVFAYHGVASAFRAAGFNEVARRSATRPLMRRELRPGRDVARCTGARAAGRAKGKSRG